MQLSSNKTGLRPFGIFSRGVLMGIAEIIPGISGGTIALITGIYQRLISCLSRLGSLTFKYIWRRDWKGLWLYQDMSFLLPLVLGMTVGFLSLVNIINFLLDGYGTYVWGFFFGLVSASAIFVLKTLPLRYVILAGIPSSLIGIVIALVPQRDSELDVFLVFISGFFAVTAWMLPGVSGAFILLIIGSYEPILQAIKDLNIAMLIVFALGGIIGIISTSRLIKWALEHYRYAVLSTLMGLVVGSLMRIWPWRLDDFPVLPTSYASLEFFGVALLMLTGIAVVTVFSRLSERAP